MRSAAPLVVADGRVLGVARITSPHTAEVRTTDARVLTARAVGLRWTTGEAGAADSGQQERPAPSADASRLEPPVLPVDPAAVGPHAVRSATYDLGDTAMRLDALPGKPVETRGVVHVPVVAADRGDPLPVVVFLHGMHEWCQGPSDGSWPSWPCPAGQEPVPSYRGYDRYAAVLASHGYAVVSISADGVNAHSNEQPDLGNRARGEAVLRTLDLLRTWSSGGGGPLGSLVAGRLDFSRVGLMGHSRGGEGAVRAALMNAARPQPYGVRAVLPLAPTDFQRAALPHVAMSVLLPLCDGDVSDLQGQHYFDDARYVTGGRDEAPRSVVVMHGANHNFYNKEWTPGPDRPTGFDDWGGDPRDPACGPAGPVRLTAAEQVRAGTAVVAGFFRAYLGRERSLLPMFDGSGARPAGFVAELDEQAQQPDRDRVDLARFDRGLQPATASGAVSVESCAGATEGPQDRPGSVPWCTTRVSGELAPQWVRAYLVPGYQTTRVAHLRWSGSGALTVPARVDASGYDALTFRAAPDVSRGASPDLVVRVTDILGAYADVSVSSVSPALTLTPGTWAPRVLLRQVHVPLRSLPGLALDRLASVQLRTTGKGGAYVADVALARAGLGQSRPTPLPQASVEDLRIVEQDGPVLTQVRVSLDRTSPRPVRVYVEAEAVAVGGDFAPAAVQRLVEVPPGRRTVTVPLRLPGDRLDQEDERLFRIGLAARRGAVPGDDLATGVLVDDDPSPTVRVGAARVVEGGRFLKFPLELSTASGRYVEVALRAADGTAVLGEDFGIYAEDGFSGPGRADGATRRFTGYVGPGDARGWAYLPVTDDDVAEPVETLRVVLLGAHGAELGSPRVAVGTIADDD